VGTPFTHAQAITGLALSCDCTLLASASSFENIIKLWAFQSRQLIASFDVHNIHTLILSPNSRQLAYTTFDPSGIHICDIPPDIIARIWPEQATCSVHIFTTYIHL
jgi:WD40 repeat protein